MSLSGNDLKIVVGAQLNTKEAKEALNNFVKTSSQTKVVFNTEVDENGFKKIEKVYRTLNKYIDEQGNLLETTTHQRELANGKLSEENGIITKVVEGYKKLSEAQKNSFKDSNLISKSVTKGTDAFGRLVTVIEKYNKEGNKFKQVITEQKNSYGEITRTIDEYIGEEEKLTKHYVEEIKDLDELKKAQEEYNSTLQKSVKLRESHTYRTYNKNDKRYENVTVETITDEYENKVKTITREYETLAGTVKIVSQQTKDLGKAWSEEQKISEEVVSNEIKAVQKLYEETVKYKNAKGQTVTRITSKDSEGNWHATITKEYIELGKKVQETTEYIKKQGEAWKTEGETSKKVVNDELEREQKLKQQKEDSLNQLIREKEAIRKRNEELLKANTYTTNYKSKEKEVLNLKDKTIHKLQTETKEVKNGLGELEKVTTTTDKWVDSQGMLHTKLTESTQKFNKYGKEIGKVTEKVTENVEKSRTGLNQLGQSFSDIIVKVAKFYLASLPIRAMQTAITSAIQSVKDFDSALTEFKKVSDLSGESLNKYTEKLEQLGKLTARTRKHSVREYIVICI